MATSADVVLRLEQRVRWLQVALGATLLLFAVAAVAIGLIVRELVAIRRDGQTGALVRGANLRVEAIRVSDDHNSFETMIDPTGIHIRKADVSDGQPYVEANLRGDELSLYHKDKDGRGRVKLDAYPGETRLRLEQQGGSASFAVRPDGGEMSLHVQSGHAQFSLDDGGRDTGFRFLPNLATGAGAWLEFDKNTGPTLQLTSGNADWKVDASTPR